MKVDDQAGSPTHLVSIGVEFDRFPTKFGEGWGPGRPKRQNYKNYAHAHGRVDYLVRKRHAPRKTTPINTQKAALPALSCASVFSQE